MVGTCAGAHGYGLVMTDSGDDVGDLHVATVVVNVQDMRRAVDFWCAALGYRLREPELDPRFVMLVDPGKRRVPVSLQLAEGPPREPVRVHLDLSPTSRNATSSGSSASVRPG